MTSSEEIVENDDYQFIVHTLPWRGRNPTKLPYALDKKSSKNSSVRSKHMIVKWKEGLPPDTLKPDGYPEYVSINDCNDSSYSIIYFMSHLSNHLNSSVMWYIMSMKCSVIQSIDLLFNLFM